MQYCVFLLSLVSPSPGHVWVTLFRQYMGAICEMRLRESPVLWCLKGALVVLSLLSFFVVSSFICLSHPSAERTPGPSHSFRRWNASFCHLQTLEFLHLLERVTTCLFTSQGYSCLLYVVMGTMALLVSVALFKARNYPAVSGEWTADISATSTFSQGFTAPCGFCIFLWLTLPQ